MTEPPTLQATDVTVRVGGRALLESVSLSLPSGSMAVLLGPNGAGKTTLLRVLAGVLAPTGGQVRLGAKPLRQLGRAAIARKLAYLPQQTGTNFLVRVEDAVALGRFPHVGTFGALSRADYERVDWALERVGLTALRGRTLPTLSGGERQRAVLARALVQEAPVLLLDEPAAALDLGWQTDLMALLRELHREGRTVVAALHDLRSALEFFPRALLLERGRLAADGPTEGVVFGEAFAAAFGVHVWRGEGLCFGPLGPAGRGTTPGSPKR